MAQVDSIPSVTSEALLRIQSNLCGIFGGKVDLGQFYLHTHTHTHTLQFSCVTILPPGLHTQYFAHLQSTLPNPSKRQLRYQKHFSIFQHILNYPFLYFVHRASQYICVIKTNFMHCLSSVYFINQPYTFRAYL